MDVKVVESKSLAIGNNEYETGNLAIPANGKYATGTLLARAGDGGFKAAVSTGETPDTVIAILPVDVENTTDAAASKNLSVLIQGTVRMDMLHFAATPTTPLTPAQRDALRDYGMVARSVTNWGVIDNGAQGGN
jgi:hypothetical protein